MKRIILVILSLVLCIGVLAGCTAKKTELDKVKDSVSYEQTSLFAGENDNFRVEVASGTREINMVSDGARGEMMDFCVMTLHPKKADMFDKKYSYTLVGDKGELNGECKRAVVGINQVADVLEVTKIGNIAKIVIRYDEEKTELELTNITKNIINGMTALEKVYADCKDNFTAMFADDNFGAEVHIKLTMDRSNADSKYLWYVSVYGDKDCNIYALVDTVSGELVAKRIKGNEEK